MVLPNSTVIMMNDGAGFSKGFFWASDGFVHAFTRIIKVLSPLKRIHLHSTATKCEEVPKAGG